MRDCIRLLSRASIAGAMFVFLVAASGLLFASAIAQGGPAQERGFSTVDSVHLAAILRTKDFFFVNVHIPYEGEIADTDAHIAFDRIAENLGSFPSEKDAKIVLYCMSDRMSGIAAEQLARLGYTNVSHLSGGMIAWEASGNRLTK